MAWSRKQKGWCIFLIAFVLAAALLALGLLSFSFVEYYEYGFQRRRSAGTVYTDTIFTQGRYFLGPDGDFLTYRSDAHLVTLDQIDVFTHDKLEVKITVHFQYFLRKDELVTLHKTYNVGYKDVMINSAVDAIKGAIPVYTTRELINNRTEVEIELYRAVRQRLGGQCCRPNCSQYLQACPDGCKALDTPCEDKDKGLHVDVMFFQLTKVNIPEDVKGRYIEALVLQEKNLRAKLEQEKKLIIKETNAKVKELQNTAIEITQDAYAKAKTVRAIATAEYNRIIENARIIALRDFYGHLNISQQEHMTSIDYMRSLKANKKAKITVGFDQRIAGNL